MSRTSDMQQRKSQIINATMDALDEHGFCDLKISDVAKRANVSAGLVCHHFGTKRGLLLATMQSAVDAYQAQSVQVIADHPDYRDRILALVQTALSPEQVSVRLSSVWLTLYYLTTSDPDFHEQLQRYQKQNHENILSALSPIYKPDVAEKKSRLIAALIDGVWLQSTARSKTVNLELTQNLAVDLAQQILAEC